MVRIHTSLINIDPVKLWILTELFAGTRNDDYVLSPRLKFLKDQ